jgi:hypothetical protein
VHRRCWQRGSTPTDRAASGFPGASAGHVGRWEKGGHPARKRPDRFAQGRMLRTFGQFAAISRNWRGKPLVSHQVIVQLIGATTTQTGLTVRCELDANRYPKGIKVTDAEMAALAIERDAFHGEWNYTISPNLHPP